MTFSFSIERKKSLLFSGYHNGAKNINDCPVQTINHNRTCGQSFMFFAQAKAARTDFKVLQACGRLRQVFQTL